MGTAPPKRAPEVAKVDFLIDERGSRIDVPEDSGLRVATRAEQQVGLTGPANWWRLGLVVLGGLALVLLVLQLFTAGPASTDVAPGTPSTPPAAIVQPPNG